MLITKEIIMTNKKTPDELDKNQRIKKHERTHGKDHEAGKLKNLQPHHKPAKKQHVNILDAYEKFGEDVEDRFDE